MPAARPKLTAKEKKVIAQLLDFSRRNPKPLPSPACSEETLCKLCPALKQRRAHRKSGSANL